LTDCEELTGIDDPSTPTVPTGTSDPNDPCDPIGLDPTDTDGDGLTDCEEITGVDDPATPTVPTGTSDPNDPCDPIKCGLEVPEGFTPDGNLVNDFFVIPGIENYPGNELLVFNRWGNKVYEVGDYDNTWDGTMNVGIQLSGNTELPTGTYFYILNTKDMNIGNYGVLQGYVYIQR
jgi:gliding motility-associated-like protein